MSCATSRPCPTMTSRWPKLTSPPMAPTRSGTFCLLLLRSMMIINKFHVRKAIFFRICRNSTFSEKISQKSHQIDLRTSNQLLYFSDISSVCHLDRQFFVINKAIVRCCPPVTFVDRAWPDPYWRRWTSRRRGWWRTTWACSRTTTPWRASSRGCSMLRRTSSGKATSAVTCTPSRSSSTLTR